MASDGSALRMQVDTAAQRLRIIQYVPIAVEISVEFH
jgi:hypothetical protein